MGKRLGRKQSYGRVEKEDSSCVWTVFRLMNYHPWHNVKKMLPYINHHQNQNQKARQRSNKFSNEGIEFGNEEEIEDDDMTNYSASVNSSPSSRNGSGSRKRSFKARIKALVADKSNHKPNNKINTIQEHELLAFKEAYIDNLSTPTLISLLSTNHKLLTTLNPPVNTSSDDFNHNTTVKPKDDYSKHDDEYVGVLDLFKVDQDLFAKVLNKDTPPPTTTRKHRLTKSGSFPFYNIPNTRNPSTFGRSPSKLEHKHNEIWPIPNQVNELRKAKSHSMARSSSLKEALDKYVPLIEATTSVSNKRVMNRNLSKSLKLGNENEFASLSLLSDQHGRKSFRERMFVPEVDSEAPRASLDCFLHSMSSQCSDQVRVLRLDSPPSEIEVISNGYLKSESVDDDVQGECIHHVDVVELFDDVRHSESEEKSSIFELDFDHFQHDQIENVDWPILQDIVQDVQENETEVSYNENRQYVKYVLDIIGFTTTTNEQLEAWHSPDQPLDPALFDGIEICCPFEPKPSSKTTKELTMTSSQRKILFDLINEALFDIHENSYAYYPKPLTNGCMVHPESKGNSRVVERVWEFVREWVDWQAELDVELNVAVGHELNRHKNGWSNLQTDVELLGIDLEDLIFDELLDEILCCL